MKGYREVRASGPPSSETAASRKLRPGEDCQSSVCHREWSQGWANGCSAGLRASPTVGREPRLTCCSLRCGVCLEKANIKILVGENTVYSGF